MAAPFVRVTINDQSIYASPSPTTIPFIMIATRSAKSRPDGAGISLGTLESGKLRLIASQRELIQTYGNPVFVTSDGVPVHGDETNEYGLMTAHSVLGLTNRAYVLRADLDLGQLVPNQVEPVLPAPDGTYWLNTTTAVAGIFRWSGTAWVRIQDVGGIDSQQFRIFTAAPDNLVGANGDWAWDYSTINGTLYFKDAGVWVIASDANLVTAYGAGTNLYVASSAPIGPASGDYWYKTTSSSGGIDPKITKYRAVDGQWVSQVVVRANTAPVPNEGTLWEDTTTINTNGQRPLYIGTGSQFIALPLVMQATAPVSDPATGTLWFNDNFLDFAMYVEGADVAYGNQWVPVVTTTNSNPTSLQKVISASPPAFPDQNSIWIDISTPQYLDRFPVVRKYVTTAWMDITDSVMIQSDDPDASAVLNGTYWINTGESRTKYTVKIFDPTFEPVTVVFSSGSYSVVAQADNYWRPHAGETFGRKAQRQTVVTALQAAIVASDELRSEAVYFQLMAVPGYPELYDEMIGLNSDNGEITFVVADTPKWMRPSGIAVGREITLTEWITNANNAETTGELAFTSTPSPYAAMWTPWGLGTDLAGNNVMVPSSHIALRTIAYSDSISAPWFAPAGTTNGIVDNASSVGYLNNDGDYQPVLMNRAQKNISYQNKINPIIFRSTSGSGNGMVIMGQKTLSATASALDRIDVSRLILKMKYDLQKLLEPFIMRKNDSITRRAALITTERYLAGLKSLRALYDYAARCDEINNTAARIDANQLWVDVAIKPSKTIEFIFVPVSILGTGDQLPF